MAAHGDTPSNARLPGRRVTATQRRVLAWYDEHRRAFAFRGPRDPYGVLVSEVILQQTQAARGDPAWAAFLERFPTVHALATATPAAVLRAWAGLGYNRRALNLQRAAAAIVERHGGVVPRTVAELEALPGVGPYTARAVLAIAFGMRVAPVDTNVRRVLGRVAVGHGASRDPGTPVPAREVQALADGLVPQDRAADWTAALMDIGAALCTPRRPACARCPLAPTCTYATAPRPAEPDAAARAPVPRRVHEPAGRYETTSRWLRGRLVAGLRELPDGTWSEPPVRLGDHHAATVRAMLEALAGEGLVELGEGGRARLPLR